MKIKSFLEKFYYEIINIIYNYSLLTLFQKYKYETFINLKIYRCNL